MLVNNLLKFCITNHNMTEDNYHVLNILPCGYMLTCDEGMVLYANDFMLNLFQMDENEVVDKKNIRDFLSLGVKVYFETNLNALLKMQGNFTEVNLEIAAKDGKWVPVLVNAKVITQPLTNIISIHYTFFDITQRKKIEAELRLASYKQELLIKQLTVSNNNYQLLAKELEKNKNFYKKQTEIHKHISQVGRVGGWEIDLIKGELIWSEVTKQIHEVDTQTQPNLQEGISFFKEGETRTSITNVILNSVKTGNPFDEELQIVTAKGNQVWVRIMGFAETTEDKNIKLAPAHSHLTSQANEAQTIRLYGTFQDIDKQKKNMLLLQQSNSNIAKDNAYLKSMVENNLFYIIKIDLEGNYTYFNPFFIEKMGIEPGEWLGKSSMSLIIPQDHQLCIDTVNKCFAEPDKSQLVVLRKPTQNGITSNQWEFSILKDESGNLTEFLCIGYEITPLLKKQEELELLLNITSNQNIRLNNFTHIVSHNIRSHVANLTGIISITDLDNVEETAISWGLIKNTVSSLDETINNLNQIISIQSEKELPVANLNIYDEIIRLLQGITLLIERSKIAIVYDFEPTLTLNTNAAYFESIILNLVTNAIKYKAVNINPQIQISVFKKQNFKVISFKDNGLGIDLKRHSDKIFGMYKTFHNNKDAKGLGLFIIKTQIEAMGGKIEVISKIGEGTTFNVYFLEKSDN